MQEATFYLLNNLRSIYPEGEAATIADWLLQHLTGSGKAERMVYKYESITPEEEQQLILYTKRLLKHEPVQYVLNEAWFGGMKFYVDQNVLIPRPETEELVEWVFKELKNQKTKLKILDIGTGSGCIAIVLKKKLPDAELRACDISDEALAIARKNAKDLNAPVDFISIDFLNKEEWKQLPPFDIIVSNPPYVPEKDKTEMQDNVLNYEPHIALFVKDEDPLVFYKTMAEFAKEKLVRNGKIFMEIHENLGDAVSHFFQSEGYSAETRKDMQGKERMIKLIPNF